MTEKRYYLDESKIRNIKNDGDNDEKKRKCYFRIVIIYLF